MEEAVSIGKKAKVTVITGVELKVKNEPERGLKDVEILGYFLDLKNEKLLATLQKRQESKIRKTTRQVELIERNGYMIPIGEVVEKARVPRRIHIWEVLQQRNPNIAREEFFSRTGYGGIWYVEEDFTITVEDCVRLIKDAEGVPVVAHPGCYNERFRTESLLRDENTFNVLRTCKRRCMWHRGILPIP